MFLSLLWLARFKKCDPYEQGGEKLPAAAVDAELLKLLVVDSGPAGPAGTSAAASNRNDNASSAARSHWTANADRTRLLGSFPISTMRLALMFADRVSRIAASGTVLQPAGYGCWRGRGSACPVHLPFSCKHSLSLQMLIYLTA